MKIVVLGCGAMGSLFSCYLSVKHDVTVVDVNVNLVDKINRDGLLVKLRDEGMMVFHPKAVTTANGIGPVDLVVVFVKSMYSAAALEQNKALIGPGTYLMSLQNGMGHEDLLRRYAYAEDHVVLGTTQHNASIQGLGEIRHNGKGETFIGNLTTDVESVRKIAEAFSESGIHTSVKTEIYKMIWNKLFTNISASVLTGILQVKLGYILENSHAWELCQILIKEAVEVANAEGMDFSVDEKISDVRRVCQNTPDGVTSIYADIRDGRRTEVDTISYSVVKAGLKVGVQTPVNDAMVRLVHALEGR